MGGDERVHSSITATEFVANKMTATQSGGVWTNGSSPQANSCQSLMSFQERNNSMLVGQIMYIVKRLIMWHKYGTGSWHIVKKQQLLVYHIT